MKFIGQFWGLFVIVVGLGLIYEAIWNWRPPIPFKIRIAVTAFVELGARIFHVILGLFAISIGIGAMCVIFRFGY